MLIYCQIFSLCSNNIIVHNFIDEYTLMGYPLYVGSLVWPCITDIT